MFTWIIDNSLLTGFANMIGATVWCNHSRKTEDRTSKVVPVAGHHEMNVDEQ